MSFVDPEGIGSTIGFGAHVDLGEIIENLVIYPTLEYWNKNEDGVEFSAIQINGDVRYYFPTPGNVKFFGGGGLGLAFFKGKVETFFGSESDTETRLGLDLLGGADFPLSEKLMATAKLKFFISDANVLKISGGLTYLISR